MTSDESALQVPSSVSFTDVRLWSVSVDFSFLENGKPYVTELNRVKTVTVLSCVCVCGGRGGGVHNSHKSVSTFRSSPSGRCDIRGVTLVNEPFVFRVYVLCGTQSKSLSVCVELFFSVWDTQTGESSH
ncbi:hypothetical protein BaRGS_00011893 [Batillaria attramentaria]|uniref:Uncharacterized protein n=1 Tax=Batillaria attramentaria TaxID=370345 RepID=A0ABD0LBX6_9CAEN